MPDYAGKVAYVTGSGSGIGRGLALAFARGGAALALVDILPSSLEEVKAAAEEAGSPKVTIHVGDVTDNDRLAAIAGEVLDAHGEVHYLCANAGVGLAGIPFTKVTPEEVRWSLDVNTISVYETVRSLMPSMLAHGKPAHILCTASLAALVASPGWHIALYAAAKFGVAALSQGMRDEIGDRPIRVSTIYPGLTRTNIGANFLALRPAGGVTPDIPEGLAESEKTISPDQSAQIILAAAAAGVEDIFTHPDDAREMHQEYCDRIQKGIAGSSAVVARIRDHVTA
ncbi:SDR family oxidoreductase [Sphingobium sp. DC-2]|uniref:SDR family NAD(P)-dependent oxidoreductase n=1 Tax=Sphingobium sp. DC-2 TaxID=1303256 RepID=UPI00068D16BF|nr:SDR family oxidoreductase [Sphingobium sp. DC-2]